MLQNAMRNIIYLVDQIKFYKKLQFNINLSYMIITSQSESFSEMN
jgi:hypothetical protein